MASILPSVQENLAKLERNGLGPSDDDRIEIQQDIAKKARDSTNIKLSVEQIKELGKEAIAMDSEFVAVSRAFEQFVEEYGTKYPKTKEFLTQWLGIHATWKTILRESRDFASTTSGEYRKYDEVYLKFVQELKTKEDLAEVIKGLTRFGYNYSYDKFTEKFLVLGQQIKFFREDFDKYLAERKQLLTDKVKELQWKLQKAEATARECDRVIRETAKWIEIIPIIGLFAREITETWMPETVKMRNRAQADAKWYKQELVEANKPQPELPNMQTKFAPLDSNFQILCGALAIFAGTSAYFHSEALKFAEILKTYDDVKDLPKTLLCAVDLARAISRPLQEGLDAYSQVIVLSP